MQVDFKVTTWERINVPSEHEEKVIEKLQNGEIQNANDLSEYLESLDCWGVYDGILEETSEQMSVEENDGCSTIEAIDDGGIDIWKNSKI